MALSRARLGCSTNEEEESGKRACFLPSFLAGITGENNEENIRHGQGGAWPSPGQRREHLQLSSVGSCSLQGNVAPSRTVSDAAQAALKQQVRGTAVAAAAPSREPPALPALPSPHFCSLFVHPLCKQRERGSMSSPPCHQHLPQQCGSGRLAEDGTVPVPPLPGASRFPGHSQPLQSCQGLPASLSKHCAAGFQDVRTSPREGCLEEESGSHVASASPPWRGRLREGDMGGSYREVRKRTAPDLPNKAPSLLCYHPSSHIQ